MENKETIEEPSVSDKHEDEKFEPLDVGGDEDNKSKKRKKEKLKNRIFLIVFIVLLFVFAIIISGYLWNIIIKKPTVAPKPDPKPKPKPVITQNKTELAPNIQQIELTVTSGAKDQFIYVIGHDFQDHRNRRQLLYTELDKAKMFVDDKPIKKSVMVKLSKGAHTVKYQFDYDLKTAEGLFANCKNITAVKFTNFKAKNINNMHSMFHNCKSLQSVEGLASIDAKNVITTKSMFVGCASLVSVDLSAFATTDKLTDMSMMFMGCSALASADLSHFVTTNVKDMTALFSGCKAMKWVNVLKFDTKNVEGMEGMFDQCASLTILNLASFNTKKVKNANYIFDECTSLKEVTLSKECEDLKDYLDKKVKVNF